MPGKPIPPRKSLSELEHELMDILWKRGPGTAEQIREALRPQRALNDSTVRTVLGRLKQKGYVDYRVQGKAFLYSVVEKPRNIAAQAVRQIVDRFCNGSLEQLLIGLVEDEVVDRAELQELARKLAQVPRERKGPKGEEPKGEK
jgi:BlaI family transcriptional regulator, penicillinase repressor